MNNVSYQESSILCLNYAFVSMQSLSLHVRTPDGKKFFNRLRICFLLWHVEAIMSECFSIEYY